MKSDIRWGIRVGLSFAALFSAWVLVLYTTQGPGAFERLGVTVWGAVLTYLTGGVVAGAIVGALRPLAKTRVGAMAVGVLAALPVAAAACYLLYGAPLHWKRSVVIACGIYAVFIGLVCGSWFWSRFVARKVREN